MRDILVIAILIGLVPFILARAWIGVLAWTWVGLMNPHQLGWGAAGTFPAAMVVGLATLVALVFAPDKRAPAWNAAALALLLTCLFYTLKLPFALSPWPIVWEYYEKFMKILLMTFVIAMLIHGEYRIRWFFGIVVVSLGFYGFKGGIFVITTGGHYMVQGPEASFIGGNTHLGVALIMILPLVFAGAEVAQRRWVRNLSYATFWLTVLAIIFTYSRGALLGLLITFPFIFMRMKRKGLVVAMLLPTLLLGVALVPEKLFNRAETIQTYEQDHSAMQRIQAWSVAKNIAFDHPIAGGGFSLDTIGHAEWLGYADFMGEWNNRPRAAHSIYFQVLGEHGFIGLGLFLTALIGTMASLRTVRRAAGTLPNSEWIAHIAGAVQIGLLGYMTAGAFVSLAYFDLFYTYVALSAILYREVMERKQALGSPAIGGWRPPNSWKPPSPLMR